MELRWESGRSVVFGGVVEMFRWDFRESEHFEYRGKPIRISNRNRKIKVFEENRPSWNLCI